MHSKNPNEFIWNKKMIGSQDNVMESFFTNLLILVSIIIIMECLDIPHKKKRVSERVSPRVMHPSPESGIGLYA